MWSGYNHILNDKNIISNFKAKFFWISFTLTTQCILAQGPAITIAWGLWDITWNYIFRPLWISVTIYKLNRINYYLKSKMWVSNFIKTIILFRKCINDNDIEIFLNVYFITTADDTFGNLLFLSWVVMHGRDRMVHVVGFTTTCAISAYHH
jgi:hypothetical protein